jgi:hypothetical protein
MSVHLSFHVQFAFPRELYFQSKLLPFIFRFCLFDSFLFGRAQRHDQDGKGGRKDDQDDMIK